MERKWKMTKPTVSLLIMNQTEFNLVPNQEGYCQHDHIPLNNLLNYLKYNFPRTNSRVSSLVKKKESRRQFAGKNC